MGAVDIPAIITECGFEFQGVCDAHDLLVREEVRDMCAADKCQHFDKTWVCPPACGPIEEFQKVFDSKSLCYVAQTVADLEDDFDFEGMQEAAELQGERFMRLLKTVKQLAPEALVLGSGTCTTCPECTYPDKPCRFPDTRMVSMEAAGLWVSEVCTAAGVAYNHGPHTIAYSGCVVI